jgi:hypothetical protein
MRKLIWLLWAILLFPSITWAQDKIEAPVWNVGDKWALTQGSVEVVSVDQNSYTLTFSKDTCRVENMGHEKIVFDKSTLNKIDGIREDKCEKITQPQRRILDFPFNLGKEWSDTGTVTPSSGPMKGITMDFSETFKVLGWEDVKVQAGIFKTIKLRHTIKNKTMNASGESLYWYAPEVKYFVKCEYDTSYWLGVTNWELISFQLTK